MGQFTREKLPNTIHLCFQNVGGTSQVADGDGNFKLYSLLQFTIAYQIDISQWPNTTLVGIYFP